MGGSGGAFVSDGGVGGKDLIVSADARRRSGWHIEWTARARRRRIAEKLS